MEKLEKMMDSAEEKLGQNKEISQLEIDELAEQYVLVISEDSLDSEGDRFIGIDNRFEHLSEILSSGGKLPLRDPRKLLALTVL